MDNGSGAAAAPQHAAGTAIHAEIVWPQIKRHSIWPFSVPEDLRQKIWLLRGRDPQFRQVDAGKRQPTDLPRIQ